MTRVLDLPSRMVTGMNVNVGGITGHQRTGVGEVIAASWSSADITGRNNLGGGSSYPALRQTGGDQPLGSNQKAPARCGCAGASLRRAGKWKRIDEPSKGPFQYRDIAQITSERPISFPTTSRSG